MLTDAQRAIRKTGLGSSDIGAVAGFSKWRNALAVYADKRGLLDPTPETAFTKAGSRSEPLIAEYAVEALGCPVVTPAEFIDLVELHGRYSETIAGDVRSTGVFRHPEKSWALASPDRFALHPDGLANNELKWVSQWNEDEWGPSGGDGVPELYMIQAQWQMFVTGIHQTFIAALIGGHDFRLYPIPFDRDLVRMLVDVGATFWADHVVPGIPPKTEPGDPVLTELIRRKHPHADKGQEIEIDSGDPLVVEWIEARAAIQASERRVEALRQKFMERMGGAYRAKGPWGSATFAEHAARKTTDWRALAVDAKIPKALVEKFTKTGEAKRVLTIRAKGDEE